MCSKRLEISQKFPDKFIVVPSTCSTCISALSLDELRWLGATDHCANNVAELQLGGWHRRPSRNILGRGALGADPLIFPVYLHCTRARRASVRLSLLAVGGVVQSVHEFRVAGVAAGGHARVRHQRLRIAPCEQFNRGGYCVGGGVGHHVLGAIAYTTTPAHFSAQRPHARAGARRPGRARRGPACRPRQRPRPRPPPRRPRHCPLPVGQIMCCNLGARDRCADNVLQLGGWGNGPLCRQCGRSASLGTQLTSISLAGWRGSGERKREEERKRKTGRQEEARGGE